MAASTRAGRVARRLAAREGMNVVMADVRARVHPADARSFAQGPGLPGPHRQHGLDGRPAVPAQHGVYNVTKHAVVALTETLYQDHLAVGELLVLQLVRTIAMREVVAQAMGEKAEIGEHLRKTLREAMKL